MLCMCVYVYVSSVCVCSVCVCVLYVLFSMCVFRMCVFCMCVFRMYMLCMCLFSMCVYVCVFMYVGVPYVCVPYVCVCMCVFRMCVYVCVRSVCVCRCVWSATNTHGQSSLQFAGGDAEAVQHQVLPHAVNPLSPGGQDGTHKVPTLPLTAGETPHNLQHRKLPSVNQIRIFQNTYTWVLKFILSKTCNQYSFRHYICL